MLPRCSPRKAFPQVFSFCASQSLCSSLKSRAVLLATAWAALAVQPSDAAQLTAYPSDAPAWTDIGHQITDYPEPSTGVQFASPTVASGGNGTRTNPRSIYDAMTFVPSNGTVILLAGTYRIDHVTNLNRPFTIQPDAGAEVRVLGSAVETSWGNATYQGHALKTTSSVGHVFLNTGRYDPNNDLVKESGVAINPRAGRGEMVFANGKALYHVNSLDELVADPNNAFYIDDANSTLHISANHVGKTIEVTTASGFVNFNDASDTGARVRGLFFAHFADTSVSMTGDGMTLENNTFAWNGLSGAAVYLQGGTHRHNGTKVNGLNNTVVGNQFIANGRNGLASGNQDNLKVEGNYFAHNNVDRFNPNHAAAGFKITSSHNVDVVNNVLEDNYAAAMWFDVSCHKIDVIANLARDSSFVGDDTTISAAHNGGAFGLHVELTDEANVAFNLFDGNAKSAIYISESSDTDVYNNTIVNAREAAIMVKDSNRRSNSSAIPQIEVNETEHFGITWDTHNTRIHNNVLHSEKNILVSNGGLTRDPSNPSAGPWQTRYVSGGTEGNYTFATINSSMDVMVSELSNNSYLRENQPQDGTGQNNQPLIRWGTHTTEFVPYTSVASLPWGYGGEDYEYLNDHDVLDVLFIGAAVRDYHLRPRLEVGGDLAVPADIHTVAAAAGVPFITGQYAGERGVIDSGGVYKQVVHGSTPIISIEAETAHQRYAKSNDTWSPMASGSASGGVALVSGPDNGAFYGTGFAASAPGMSYEVKFDQAGTYYVWIRGRAVNTNGKSIHIGLDDQEASATQIRFDTYGSWLWRSVQMDLSTRATIDVTSAGVHTVNLWMREDGFVVDQVVLTTSQSYNPAPSTPPLSPLSTSPQPVVFTHALSVYSTQHVSGGATTEDDRRTVHLEGNTWQKYNLNYTVTADTVLRFEFLADHVGRIIGIGLDDDNTYNTDTHIFQLAGSVTWNQAFQNFKLGSYAPGTWVPFEIGFQNFTQYFQQGQMKHLVFVNDDDGAALGDVRFRNIELYDAP